jgi:hypothetical protein
VDRPVPVDVQLCKRLQAAHRIRFPFDIAAVAIKSASAAAGSQAQADEAVTLAW